MPKKNTGQPNLSYGGYDDYRKLMVEFDAGLSALKEQVSVLEVVLEVACGEVDDFVFEKEDPDYEDESLRDALEEAKDRIGDYESESSDFEIEVSSLKRVLENPRLGFGNGLNGFQFTIEGLKDAVDETFEKVDEFESSLSDLEFALSDLEYALGTSRRRWSRTLKPVELSLVDAKAALQVVKDGS